MANVFDQFDAKNPFDQFDAPAKPEPVQDFSGNLRFATPAGELDTGVSLPQWLNRRLAQLGSGFADVNQGMAQAQADAAAAERARGNTLLGTPPANNVTKQDVSSKRSLDKTLNNDFMGTALGFTGKVLPFMAMPATMAGSPVIGGAIGGLTQGTFEPVGPSESRETNTALGYTLGGTLPAVVSTVRSAITPKGATSNLAQSAVQNHNIPLSAADMAENRLVKGAKSVLDDIPVIGGMGAAQREAKQKAFNRAVGGTFGANADDLTPQVMDTANRAIKSELNRIWDNNTLKVDGQLVQDLQRLLSKATNLNPEQARQFERQVQNLLQKVDANGEIPGTFANNFQSELRLIADGEKGLAQNVMSDLRKATIGAFNRGIPQVDAAALAKARSQYGAYKTVSPLMAKADAGVGGRVSGDVPAALLPQQVVSQYGERAHLSPFGELPAIGSRFLVDRVPQTGGSPRAMIQNSALGTGLAIGGYTSPIGAAAALGGATGLEWLLTSPTVGRALVSPPAPVRGLLGPSNARDALLELGRAGLLSRVPTGLAPGILALPALE